MKEREINRDVLRVYQEISPSALPIEERERMEWLKDRIEKVYFKRLKIHPLMFSGARYLNLGCGSGEYDMVFSSWGATGVGLDFNEKSIKRAQELADTFSSNSSLDFSVGDICEELPFNKEFDISISDGVLPHVDSPKKLLRNLAKSTKAGGFVILGYLDLFGNIQRSLHGIVCRSLAKDQSDITSVVEVARAMFEEHLERCVTFGGRTFEAVVNDYIVNQHSYGYDTVDIIQTMEAEGLELFTSYPLSTDFIATSPADRIESSVLDNIGYIRLQQLGWALGVEKSDWSFTDPFAKDNGLLKSLERALEPKPSSGRDAITTAVKSIRETIQSEMMERVRTEIDVALEELEACVSELGSANPEEALSKLGNTRLFKGFNGMSTCYLTFYSPRDND